jgi:hypothetical protein
MDDLSDEICMICGDRLSDLPRTQLTIHYYVHTECLRKKEKALETIREHEQREDELERLRQAKTKERVIHELNELGYDY